MNAHEKMIKKIGITGGIGSGKSEACKILERMGEKVLYADLIAREITINDPEVQNEIKQIFGNEFFDKSGKIDRKKLAALVFNDEDVLSVLNSIVHPRVFKEIDRQSEKLSALGVEQVFIEAALIFETCMDDNLDLVIVIDADEKKRLDRVLKRDGMSEEEFYKRASFQLSSEEKIRLADFTIKNNGSIIELERNLLFITGLVKAYKVNRND